VRFLGFRVAELACEVIRVSKELEALSLKRRVFRGMVEGGGGPVEAAAQAGWGARVAPGGFLHELGDERWCSRSVMRRL
jgi:hypothetical protein